MKTMTTLLFLILSACASTERAKPPAFELRTFRIEPGKGALKYTHSECTRKGLLGKCREWTIVKELFDLNDPEVNAEFRNRNVVCRVRKLPLPK
ncbi:MAG TPA: hypothetical protein PK473_03085 [Nitrosomonas sp.]|nr:hypothetical protein [Nitrosomonas sp.]